MRDRIAALVSKEFFWALLFFLCVFGLGAWLFTLDNAEVVAAVVGVVVSALALIVSPTEMRGSILAALASALVLVLVAVLAVLAYGRFAPKDVTADARLDGAAATTLRSGETARVRVPVPEGWGELSIAFEVGDDPRFEGIQDCADDPETGIALELTAPGPAVDLESGDEHVVELRGAEAVDGTVTVRAREGCSMRLAVLHAELHR
ncbi:hypothetical protein AB8O55_27075 [Saccharopolyspora cebuensis]|uniref:Uncharacterized protein n=1 Tax=Saccharopolyspora cebuensis TaxID=418759 RepID=A0ABV4CT05_9PSEU